jgi:hypothetical protein
MLMQSSAAVAIVRVTVTTASGIEIALWHDPYACGLMQRDYGRIAQGMETVRESARQDVVPVREEPFWENGCFTIQDKGGQGPIDLIIIHRE